MSIERRQFERIECYMIVRQAGSAEEEEDFFGVVRNISAGGAMIETDFAVKVDSQLDLAFMMGEDRQVWESRGKVVWARPAEDKIVFGLEFLKPLEEDWRSSLV